MPRASDIAESLGESGTELVPFSMAVNLRIPEELDRELARVAEAEHVSKSALLLQGAELIVRRYSRRRSIDEGLDFVQAHDAELLRRLEDA
jgi:predicted transcriptional regulator